MYKTNSTCSMLIGIASNECVAVKVSKSHKKCSLTLTINFTRKGA